MSLGERIALARKQAGLSQEQLGEKLGVSRQAVSKWESSQTNPDVAYVAQMCRLLGVSSDWLLLGEEAARNAAPERCPGCKAIVSGLDQFCPGCGRPLRDGAEHHQGYTMLLKKKDPLSQVDLARLSDLGKFSEDSPLHKPLSQVDVQTLAHSAPVVLARGLSAVAPTYYVTGNHEWALGSKTVKELKALLGESGVTVLSNRWEAVERNGDRLALAGVDDPNGYADQTTPEELYAWIQEDSPGLFTLLLAHRNDRFPQYAAAGYGFVLSGHGHGGIVRLPFLGGLIGTNRRLFPQWTSGLYAQGDSVLFVSRGLGNNTVPFQGFRIFNRPELAVVTLKS